MEACVRYPTLHSQLSQSSKRWPGSRIQPGKPTSEEHHVFMVKLGPDHPLRNPTGMSKSPFPGNVLKATVAIFCAPYPYIYIRRWARPLSLKFSLREIFRKAHLKVLSTISEKESTRILRGMRASLSIRGGLGTSREAAPAQEGPLCTSLL